MEEAPFNLKLHIFPSRRNQGQRTDDGEGYRRKDQLEIMSTLESMGAEGIKTQSLNEDKTRYTFVINDRDAAYACFQHFTEQPEVNNGANKANVFYVKPGKPVSLRKFQNPSS